MANMLTEKEATLISDLLTMEETAFKKVRIYSRTITDPDVANAFRAVAEGHRQRFNALFDLL